MELEYNGVHLELLNLDRVERVGVYTPDGVDLMYIKWTIGAACVFSSGGGPTATTATALSDQVVGEMYGRPQLPRTARGSDPPNESDNPVRQRKNDIRSLRASNGYNAAMSDAELRQRLWTPRGKLKITAADADGNRVTWLESPRKGYAVDVANGPKPLSVDVVEATGDGTTFGVYFQIETCVAPCGTYNERLVLSHRWHMTHGYDDDYYLTRSTKGEIVFNSAVVLRQGIRPDEVRSQFIHPIPLGFKRTGPVISASPDGLTIGYDIEDVDTTIVFDPGDTGATQMSIVEKVMYDSPWQTNVVQSLLSKKGLGGKLTQSWRDAILEK